MSVFEPPYRNPIHDMLTDAIGALTPQDVQPHTLDERAVSVPVRRKLRVSWLISREPEEWADYNPVWLVEETTNGLIFSNSPEPRDDEFQIYRPRKGTLVTELDS